MAYTLSVMEDGEKYFLASMYAKAVKGKVKFFLTFSELEPSADYSFEDKSKVEEMMRGYTLERGEEELSIEDVDLCQFEVCPVCKCVENKSVMKESLVENVWFCEECVESQSEECLGILLKK